MSFFTERGAIAFRMTNRRRAHLPEGTIARYVPIVWLNSTLPLNARGGVTALFRSDAASAAHDRFARVVKPERECHLVGGSVVPTAGPVSDRRFAGLPIF